MKRKFHTRLNLSESQKPKLANMILEIKNVIINLVVKKKKEFALYFEINHQIISALFQLN